MKTKVSTDAKWFLENYKMPLQRQEAKFNLLLGLTENSTKNNPLENSYIVMESPNTCVVGMVTPVGNCVLGKLTDEELADEIADECTDLLVDQLCMNHRDLVGFVGSDGLSELVAKKYAKKLSKNCKMAMDQMIYENKKVILPSVPAGRLRIANMQDLEFLAEWFENFRLEVEPERKDRVDPKAFVEARITKGHAFLWCVEDKPVCFVGLGRETTTGITVAPVYTPKEFRNKGYGINLTAQVTELMLARGKRQVNLYTDLSNPTSNSIYKKIGYREVAASQHYVVT